MTFDPSILPTVNAVLNGLAGVLLLAGFVCIRNGWRDMHRRFMLSAVITSAVFLASYVTYHAMKLHTPYTGEGPARAVYFVLLISHIILAITVVPMALLLLWWASRHQF